MGFRILFQNILAFVDKEAAQAIFSPQENDDALPGHTDCAKIYGSGFNLEANSICFKMDTSLAVDSSSRYEIIDFRPWVVCRHAIVCQSSCCLQTLAPVAGAVAGLLVPPTIAKTAGA